MTDRPDPKTTDQQPEVEPEVIEDLDAATEEAEDVRGGRCVAGARAGAVQTQTF
jgi:hypothetical protein